MGKTEDVLVDTKNLCFLCFRPAKIVAAGVKGRRVKDKTFSLRCISRYMDVDFQKMLNAEVSSSGGQHENGRFPQVLVTVCSRCSSVTEEFATLYQYLEFTQMKINACVQNLNDLMKKTDGNSRLVEMFRKKMKTNDGLVEDTRKMLMEKCLTVLKNASPRVKVQRHGESTKVQTIAPTRKLFATAKPSPRSRKPGFSSTILKANSPQKKSLSIHKGFLSVLNPKDNKTDNTIQEKSEAGGLFKCLHCDNTFNDTDGLRLHIVRYHPEQFFAVFKSSNVSEEEFKVAVRLLFEDVRKITSNSGAQSTVSYICSCCGKPFSAQIDTYVHMVQLHYDVLSMKLQSIQKDSSLLASAKTSVQLLNVSDRKKLRGPRGPYNKKNKTFGVVDATNSNTTTSNLIVPSSEFQTSKSLKRRKIRGPYNKQNKSLGDGETTSLNDITSITSIHKSSSEKLNQKGSVYPRSCECGVQLSTKSSWHKHKRLNCELKKGSFKPIAQQTLLKRAKNTVGFPQTCECGVRLSSRQAWSNHQRLNCKLKFGTAKSSSVPNVTKSTVKNKSQSLVTVPVRPTSARMQIKWGKMKSKYTCVCGSVLNSYSSWYYHTKKACQLRPATEKDAVVLDRDADLDLDIIEEVPIDITPSGDLCLPSSSASVEEIETSPVPKIMKVTSHGGVIKGLKNMASLQGILKKETVNEIVEIPETSSFEDLFANYFPGGTSLEQLRVSLQKVLLEYRRFPGNISGCPFCGRGFSQVIELQNHMVEGHFDEVLSKLKNLIDPSGAMSFNFDGVINMDPSLVKTENEMEVDYPTDDLCGMNLPEGSHNFQNGCLEMNEEHKKLIPKQELVSSYHTHNDESSTIEVNADQLHILP